MYGAPRSMLSCAAVYTTGVSYEDARKNCPVFWAEMNAIEEEFRQFLKPGVEVPTREILSRLRQWREVALRIEFAMMGI